MTDAPSHQRKPYDHAPYAALRGADKTNSVAAAPNGDPPSLAVSEFDIEADKLRNLRGALWAAFEAGPAAGLPNTLIDLTMAYTGALRLQLNLRALAVGKRKVQPAARPGHKPPGE